MTDLLQPRDTQAEAYTDGSLQSCDEDLVNANTTASDETTESRSDRSISNIIDQEKCEPPKLESPMKVVLARPRTAGSHGKFFRSTTLVGSQRAPDPPHSRPGGLQTAELTSVRSSIQHNQGSNVRAQVPATLSLFSEEPPSPALTAPSQSSTLPSPLVTGPPSPLSSTPNSPLLPAPNFTVQTSSTIVAIPSPSSSQIPRPTSATAARRNLPPVLHVDATMSMPVTVIAGTDADTEELDAVATGSESLLGYTQAQQRTLKAPMLCRNIEPPEPLSPSNLRPSLPTTSSPPVSSPSSRMLLNVSTPVTAALPPKGQQQMGEVISDDCEDRQPSRPLIPRSASSSPRMPTKTFDEAPPTPLTPLTPFSNSESPVRRHRHTKLISQVPVQTARQRTTAPFSGESESPRRPRKPKGTWGVFNQEERVHHYPPQQEPLPDVGCIRSEPVVRQERRNRTHDKEADMIDFRSAPAIATKEPKRRPKTAAAFATEPSHSAWTSYSSKETDASNNTESISPRRKPKDRGQFSSALESRIFDVEDGSSYADKASSRTRGKIEAAQKIAGDLSHPSVPRRATTLAQRHRSTKVGEDLEVLTEINGRPVTKAEHEMWTSTFRRLQRDGELHQSHLPLALQQCGIDYLNPSMKEEVDMLPAAPVESHPSLEYATLSLDEFLKYICEYLNKSEKHFRKIYESLNDGEPIHKSQMPVLFAHLSGRLRSRTLDEVCTDVSSVCRGSPIGYFTFEDAIRVVELYKSRQGFRKLELDQFQLAMKVFDRKGNGDIPLSELPSALLWLGLSLPEVELRTMIDEVVGSEATSLTHRHFLLLLRKALEREMLLVEQKLGPLTNRGSLSGFFIESLLRELGCQPPAVAILEAMQDLSLGGSGAEEALEQLRREPERFQGSFALKGFCFQLTAEEVCDLLMKIRSREGFTRSEWQDLRAVYDRFAGETDGRVNVQGVGKALRWMGYNFCLNQTRHFMAEVDAEGGNCVTVGFRSFVKVVKCAQSLFKDRISEVFESYAGDRSTSALISKRDIFAAMQALDCLHSKTMPSAELPNKVSLTIFRGLILSAREELQAYYHNHSEYGPAMVQKVKECFQHCPTREEDTISHKDMASIIQHLYPNYAQSSEWRSNLVSLIEAMVKDSGQRISFKSVLQLVREIDDSEEEARLAEELGVIEEVKASPTDVRDTRSLFLEMLKRSGRRDLQKLPLAPVKTMVRNCLQHGPRKQHIVDGFVDQAIREAGARGAQFVEQIQTSDHAEPQLAVDFPLFLRIMRKVDEESAATSAPQHARQSTRSNSD